MWCYQQPPLSSCGYRRDQSMGIFPGIRRVGVDGLHIDENMPESAAKAINRREISNTNNGGDGNDSEMIKRCRPGTYNTRWAGFGSTSPNGVPRSCMCVAATACCGMPACANGQMSPYSTYDRGWPFPFRSSSKTHWPGLIPSGSISSSRPCIGRGYSF